MADNKNQQPELNPEEKQKMHDNYSAMGKKGGNATKETHGSEFYHDIGEKGGEKGGNARKEQMAHSSSYTSEGDKNK